LVKQCISFSRTFSDLNPLIKLFAIDSTDSLIEVDNWLTATGKLRKRRQAPSATQAVDFIDDKLFAIRKESASQQLFLVQMSTVDVNTLLLRVLALFTVFLKGNSGHNKKF
jgi:hypothetical protein